MEKESESRAEKRGSESTATLLNSISKFKESLLLDSTLMLLRPISSQQGNFRGSFLLLNEMGLGPTKTKPMRPKNGSLDQNRQWRREEAAPIKSILAKNSLRSQIAEKEEFTHYGRHNIWVQKSSPLLAKNGNIFPQNFLKIKVF